MAPGVTKVSNGGPLTTHSAGKFQITTAGPYFTSGEIKFSVLRRLFKEQTSGAVKASQLRRVTSTSETNPIVPDSTQNAQISTENNLSMSQFRGSVKRYYADSISDGDQVHLNHYDGNNGIDWSNGGTGGADGSAANNNLSKNIQKFVHWMNLAYSSDNDGGDGGSAESKNGTGLGKIPAMSLEPAISGGAYGVYNLQLNVSGKIYGAAGRGGYKNQTNNTDTRRGKAGGTALKISHSGSTTVVYVENGARIHGGGGGGEQGKMGDDGERGQCIRKVFTTVSGSCGGGVPSCPTDYTRVRTSTVECGTSESNCRWQGRRQVCDEVTLTRIDAVCQANMGEPGPEPIRGVGGKGGDGAGWLDGQYRSNGREGELGTQNVLPDCPGDTIPSDRKAAGDGGRGGNGGAPGRAGQFTTSPDRGGSGGAAICGNNFSVEGNKNSKTLKVRYDGSCIGETSENAGSPPGLPGIEIVEEPTYVRFRGTGGVRSILVTAPNGGFANFGIKYAWDDASSYDLHLNYFDFQQTIFEQDGEKDSMSRRFDNDLGTGEYPIIWNGLHPRNSASGKDYPKVSKTLMDPDLRSSALKTLGLNRETNIEEMNVLGLMDEDGKDANGAIMIYKDSKVPYPPARIKYKLTSTLENPITNVTGSNDRGDPLFNIPNDFPAPGQSKTYTYSWRPVKYTPIKYTITATGPGGTSKVEFTVV